MGESVKVLVVDDSPFIHKIAERELGIKGVEIVGFASNGEEGIRKAREYAPDIVFLDITMPIMNGIVTAERMLAEHPEMKIVMISTMGDEELLDRVKETGAHSFLLKPLTRAKLVEAILGVLDEERCSADLER
ncbi:MAG: response regulator [Synergistales bacterium]|nr:response regulator [Synergistales bacterium]